MDESKKELWAKRVERWKDSGRARATLHHQRSFRKEARTGSPHRPDTVDRPSRSPCWVTRGRADAARYASSALASSERGSCRSASQHATAAATESVTPPTIHVRG